MFTKKNLLVGLCSLLLLAGCGGGGESSGLDPNLPFLYTTAPSTVTVQAGSSKRFEIRGGIPPYFIRNDDDAVAVGGVNDDILTIGGVATGSTAIEVVDRQNSSVVVNVSVTGSVAGGGGSSGVDIDLTISPSSATGAVGDSLTFLLTGGMPPYLLTVNNPSVLTVSNNTVTSSGGAFSTSLRNVGTGIVTVLDAGGALKTLSVTATNGTAGLRLAPGELVLAERLNSLAIQFNVYGGVAPYRIFSSNTELIAVPSGAFISSSIGVTQEAVDVDSDQSVTLTLVDSTGAAATSEIQIVDNN